MKKVLSFVLAVVMVLSLSTVAFAAANTAWNSTFSSNPTTDEAKEADKANDVKLAKGTDDYKVTKSGVTLAMMGTKKVTLNFDTGASKADDFAFNAKVKKGADVVKVTVKAADKKVEIEAIPDYSWSLNESEAFEVVIAVNATGKGAREWEKSEITVKGNVVLKADPSSDLIGSNTGATATDITASGEVASNGVYTIKNNIKDLKLTFDFGTQDDMWMEFGRIYDQGAFPMVYNKDALKDVQKTNLDASLQVYNFVSAPEFDVAGKLFLEASDEAFVYEYVDGKVVASKFAWDEDEWAWVLKTNVLGCYIVSDKELPVSAASDVVANPSTGAADMVNVAVAMAVVSIAAAGAVALKK